MTLTSSRRLATVQEPTAALEAAEERLSGAEIVADLLETRLLQGGLSTGEHAVVLKAWERADRVREHHRQMTEGLR